MLTTSYPSIGQKVSYVRQGADGQPVDGQGHIHSIVLDPMKRLMAHVESETETDAQSGQKLKMNIHLPCLNPSDEFKAAFKAMLEGVKATGDEGNGKVVEIVAEYNQRVDGLQKAVLGDFVIFE